MRSIALGTLLLAACLPSGPQIEPVPAPAESRSPVADADAALAAGDNRFLVYIGVWEFSSPGADRACVFHAKAKRRRPVIFVGDVVVTPKTAADSARVAAAPREQMILDQYVSQYNARIAAITGDCARHTP